VSFAAITLYVASQRVFIAAAVYFVMTQSGHLWIHPRISLRSILILSSPLDAVPDFLSSAWRKRNYRNPRSY
jgi:hypothetical protein